MMAGIKPPEKPSLTGVRTVPSWKSQVELVSASAYPDKASSLPPVLLMSVLLLHFIPQ